MSDAESDLSLIVGDMAENFFPWKSPTTNIGNALPWIQAVISTFLSFIPVVGPLFSLPKAALGVVTGAAQAFTNAGFQELSTVGNDPVSV